jgi:hypothetical protein
MYAVRALCDFGVSVQQCDSAQRSPLHAALELGLEDVARMLVEAGADVEALDLAQNTPLHVSARWGSPGQCLFACRVNSGLRSDRLLLISEAARAAVYIYCFCC